MYPIRDWDGASRKQFSEMFQSGWLIWNQRFLIKTPQDYDGFDYTSGKLRLRPNVQCLFRMEPSSKRQDFNIVRLTPTTDKILLIPMTYAGITGIALLLEGRVNFINKRHRALFTGSVVYIAGSVPLHIYCSYIIWDTSLMTWFPMWFSWFLLIVVYPAFLTMFAKLQYGN